MRTQVAIIGAGPAGLVLSRMLHASGIDNVVIEKKSRAYVEGRIRAGVLEQVSVDILTRLGVGERLQREGLRHGGVHLAAEGEQFRIDLKEVTGTGVTVYGQTEVTKDLIAAAVACGQPPVFEAENVGIHGIDGSAPVVTYSVGGRSERLECDFVAGCDGQHGICRDSIPAAARSAYEQTYPFGWLGILADVPPCNDELIYSNHARGFALASMRSRTRSRYYIQVPLSESLDEWPDDRLWDEIALRLGPCAAAHLTRGPALEKSIAPLRSFVTEPMRHGRLFLAGDAAHTVPPTGAKGLNLALGDAFLLAEAFAAFYRNQDERALDAYSQRALARVWKAERFSWWFTRLMHRDVAASPFERRMQLAELAYLKSSRAAQTAFAENYVGLPLNS